MMQSISNIHSRILAEYRDLKTQYADEEKAYLEALYKAYPEIESIDSAISSLAVKGTKAIIEGKISESDAVEYIKNEAQRLRAERVSVMQKNGIKGYTPDYKCSLCKDTGFSSEGQKCGCYTKKLREYLTFPGERPNSSVLDKSSFDKFELSYYSDSVDPDLGISPRKIMSAVYAECFKFANGFSGEGSGNLLLCGPSGLGKTLMASSISNAVADRGYLSIYKSSYKLFQFMEDYKFSKIDRDAYSVTNDALYDCDLLVIDDFGTEFITSYTQSAFFDLLSTRLDNDKSTVISTNLPLEKISEIYQERVMSRLKNEFEVLRFAGEDIRSIKNNK